MSFEWQTEDERSWEQPEAGGGSESPNGRRWLWMLLFAGLIITGAYLGWQQVQERVDAGAEAVRKEVRASFALAERAALERDQELFGSLLSGRSATWTDTQRVRVEQGLLFGETGRLFAFAYGGAAGAEPAVDLNPELTEAFLSVGQPFIVDAGSGITETVVLTQTHVFRRGNARWLLSPPDDDYWGSWQTRNGRALQLAYPQRDEEIAVRLHEDLERKLMELCRTLVDCPSDFGMMLRLETDVQSIVAVAGGEERLSGGRELVLPAPSLVGLPADEAAYAALFRGYARHLISAALIEAVEYDCCELAPFQEALLDWHLSRLSLRSAPLATKQYLDLVEAPVLIESMWRLSRPYAPRASDEEAPLHIHAFIDFLRSRLSFRQDPLGDIQRGLVASRSFSGWVSALTDYQPANPTPLQTDWDQFIWDKAREAQAMAQPLPAELLPEQDILAMCGNQTLDLVRYSPETGVWSQEIATDVAFSALASFPNGDGYMMTGQYPDQSFETGMVSYIGKRGSEPFLLDQEEWMMPWRVEEPGGERMVVWLFGAASSEGAPRNALVDPASCTPEGCDLQPIPGVPIWSPAGRLALAINLQNSDVLYLPPGASEWQSLAFNSSIFPFWIDEQQFGVVEGPGIGGRHALLAVDVESGEMNELIAADDLAGALPEGQRRGSLFFTVALRHPFIENALLVGALGGDNPPRSYLFLVTLGQGSEGVATVADTTLLTTLEGNLNVGWLAPEFQRQVERFLVLPYSTYSESSSTQRMLVYDLQEHRVVLTTAGAMNTGFMMGPEQWSADGRWLAHAFGQVIHLAAPAQQSRGEPLRQLIFHDFERCESPVWVNR